MFQSPGYPGGFPAGGQMPPPQYPQGTPEMRPGMFNPNVPSSSRAGLVSVFNFLGVMFSLPNYCDF